MWQEKQGIQLVTQADQHSTPSQKLLSLNGTCPRCPHSYPTRMKASDGKNKRILKTFCSLPRNLRQKSTFSPFAITKFLAPFPCILAPEHFPVVPNKTETFYLQHCCQQRCTRLQCSQRLFYIAHLLHSISQASIQGCCRPCPAGHLSSLFGLC